LVPVTFHWNFAEDGEGIKRLRGISIFSKVFKLIQGDRFFLLLSETELWNSREQDTEDRIEQNTEEKRDQETEVGRKNNTDWTEWNRIERTEGEQDTEDRIE
jgi:hypothetical protein